MNWVIPAWGCRAIVLAGLGTRDHLRVAMQALSPRPAVRVEYQHTGWRQVSGAWAYLHGGGAIGTFGTVPGVDMALPGALARACLPDPPAGADLAAAVRASLALLDLGPERVTAGVLGAVYRAPLGGADFGLHLTGPTGVFKTELVALAQQHWGPAFDARNLPGNWQSTANATEGLAFAAKDMVLVIDDFAPGGAQADVARLHKDADRVFRGVGNHSGRQRMTSTGELRAPRPPRALPLSTGEEVPRGISLRARIGVVEISRGDISADRLTPAQQDGVAGRYAAAMAGYVRWLAGRYDELRQTLREEAAALRGECHDTPAHARTPGMRADLLLGWRYFLQFAEEVSAVTAAEAGELLHRAGVGLFLLCAAQAEHQESAEPAGLFLRLGQPLFSATRSRLAATAESRPCSFSPDASSGGRPSSVRAPRTASQ
jgi:hypothetical protein